MQQNLKIKTVGTKTIQRKTGLTHTCAADAAAYSYETRHAGRDESARSADTGILTAAQRIEESSARFETRRSAPFKLRCTLAPKDEIATQCETLQLHSPMLSHRPARPQVSVHLIRRQTGASRCLCHIKQSPEFIGVKRLHSQLRVRLPLATFGLSLALRSECTRNSNASPPQPEPKPEPRYKCCPLCDVSVHKVEHREMRNNRRRRCNNIRIYCRIRVVWNRNTSSMTTMRRR